jgi:hypothetical protein
MCSLQQIIIGIVIQKKIMKTLIIIACNSVFILIKEEKNPKAKISLNT